MKRELKIRGLKVPPSIILSHFCDDSRIKDNFNVSFKIWENKDEQEQDLENFDIDLCIIPTNLSYNLFNKGYPIKLLCISVWGILYLMSRDSDYIDWESFSGKSISIPMKGNMPDTIFKILAKKNNFNISKNTSIQYCDSYLSAKDNLILGKTELAILPEPYASSAEFEGAKRILNLQKEWGKVFQCKPRYPQAGVMIRDSFSVNECRLFLDVISSSTKKIYSEPEVSSIKGEKILGVNSKVIRNSFDYCSLETISGSESFQEIHKFFRILNYDYPDIDGAKLFKSNFFAI